MIYNTQAIILAAGKSSRFNTKKTKLLASICGQPMIAYPVQLLTSMQIPTTMVLGYQKEEILPALENITSTPLTVVEQKEQKGTGHALLCTAELWNHENILVMNGDMPLVTNTIIETLIQTHQKTNAAISFVTAHYVDAPRSGYGRVITTNNRTEIIETRHLPDHLRSECTINAGIYLIKRSFLTTHQQHLFINAETQELYLTDLVKIASDHHLQVTTVSACFDYVQGINTIQELAIAQKIKCSQLISSWMDKGVIFSMPSSTYIDSTVHLGADTIIGSGVHLTGTTIIGEDCVIKEFSSLHNTIVEDNTIIHSHSVIHNAHLKHNSSVGPFAYVRENTIAENNSVIGNFVEVKNSIIGQNTKVKHLSYIGDAQLGNKVNIGAGTVICNYDGFKKHVTTIKDNSFIGSNNTLVAPLIIHQNAYTAAGSTITQDVPENSLAFGRARQVNKEQYTPKNTPINHKIDHKVDLV